MAAFVSPLLLCSVFSLPLSLTLLDSVPSTLCWSVSVSAWLCRRVFAWPMSVARKPGFSFSFSLRKPSGLGWSPTSPIPLCTRASCLPIPGLVLHVRPPPPPKGGVICAALGPHTWLRLHTQRALGNKGQPHWLTSGTQPRSHTPGPLQAPSVELGMGGRRATETKHAHFSEGRAKSL